METLELILIGFYTIVILLGVTLLNVRFMLLKGYTLNSTQKSIQNLSFISLLLSIIWGAIFLPVNLFLSFTFAPTGAILILLRFITQYNEFLIRYKFILDTSLVLFAIVLWILT